MTTQTELDADMLAVLEQHLATRRDLLKRVRSELAAIPSIIQLPFDMVKKRDVLDLMDRLIAAAELPTKEGAKS